jgi:hypothetical protein
VASLAKAKAELKESILEINGYKKTIKEMVIAHQIAQGTDMAGAQVLIEEISEEEIAILQENSKPLEKANLESTGLKVAKSCPPEIEELENKDDEELDHCNSEAPKEDKKLSDKGEKSPSLKSNDLPQPVTDEKEEEEEAAAPLETPVHVEEEGKEEAEKNTPQKEPEKKDPVPEHSLEEGEAKPDETKPDEAKPDETKPDETEPEPLEKEKPDKEKDEEKDAKILLEGDN